MQEFSMSEQSAFDSTSAELAHLLPPGAAAVRTDRSVLVRLKHELRMAPLLAQCRAEMGGILRGTTHFENGMRVLLVQSIQPVRCSYASGPTWTLTGPERLELEKLLRISPPGAPGLEVLGFYRSNIRAETAPSKEDLELYSAYFPGQDAIVMIVGSPYGAHLRIACYSREIGTSVTADPVRQGQLAPHGAEMPRELPPPDESRLRPPLPAGRAASRPWMVGLVSAAAAVLLTAMALLGYNLWRAGRATGTGSPLALQIESHSGQLLIRWDAASRLVVFARKGHITVRDGVDFRDFELSAAQVRSGKLVYLPASNNLDLRLEVEQPDGRRVGESVIFLAPPELMAAGGTTTMPEISAPPLAYPPHAADRFQPATGKSADVRLPANVVLPPRAHSRDSPPGRDGDAPPPAVSRTSPDALGPLAETAKTPAPDAPAPERRAQAIAPSVQAPAPPSPSPSAPPLSAQPSPAPENRSGRALSQQAASPPVPPQAATTPAAPTPPPQAGPAAIRAEPAPEPTRIQPSPPVPDNAPPEPIRQVSPVVPPQTRKLMHTPVEVQVKVSIDEYGKVTHAVIAGTKGPLAKFLTGAVLSAAYEWQFKPARANGHALPSDKLIVFSFSSKQ
jgi:hypothetical protein